VFQTKCIVRMNTTCRAVFQTKCIVRMNTTRRAVFESSVWTRHAVQCSNHPYQHDTPCTEKATRRPLFGRQFKIAQKPSSRTTNNSSNRLYSLQAVYSFLQLIKNRKSLWEWQDNQFSIPWLRLLVHQSLCRYVVLPLARYHEGLNDLPLVQDISWEVHRHQSLQITPCCLYLVLEVYLHTRHTSSRRGAWKLKARHTGNSSEPIQTNLHP
jgi:hypothetical protein